MNSPHPVLIAVAGTRFLGSVAATAVLILFFSVASAGQTTDTASQSKPGTDLAVSTPSLPATPFFNSPLILLPQVISSAGSNADDSGFPSAAMADLDGDGKLDLVVVGAETLNTATVMLGNGDGTFQAPQRYSTGLSAVAVTIADLNGDGKPDLVVAGLSSGSTNGEVAVLLGNGDGSFNTATVYPTGGWSPSSVATADVNRDGKMDLVVMNACGNSACSSLGKLGVLLGNGDGSFQAVKTYGTGGYGNSALAIADVNHDGNPDLLVGNNQSQRVGVLLGKGDGTFAAPAGYASGGTGTTSIVSADINGDGNLDLVVTTTCPKTCSSLSDSTVGVLLGNGDGTFQAATSYDSGGNLVSGATFMDVTGDGKNDLMMVGFCNENSAGCGSALANVFALPGNGTGSFQPAVILYPMGAFGGRKAVVTGDLNGDGKPDVVVVHGCDSTNCSVDDLEVSVMLNNTGAPATTTTLTSNKNPVPRFQAVTYTAKVTGGSGGSVTFADGDDPVKTVALSGDQATYTVTYGTTGQHQITAAYSGALHSAAGSRSSALSENSVNPTKTTLTTSGSPSFVSQPVTFTATVTSSYGTVPDGELLNFFDASTLLGSAPLTGGKAAFTTSSLTAKSHGIKAIYPGDDQFATSTGLVNQVVELYSTTTTLTCSPNPSSSGQVVTMTATVKSTGPVTPTGKVAFSDGTKVIGTGTLSAGVATLTKSNLAPGTHPITAKFKGDANSAASTSSVVNQVVN